jgi:hypothetical protein
MGFATPQGREGKTFDANFAKAREFFPRGIPSLGTALKINFLLRNQGRRVYRYL